MGRLRVNFASPVYPVALLGQLNPPLACLMNRAKENGKNDLGGNVKAE